MLKPLENVRNSIETCEQHVLHIALKGNAHWEKLFTIATFFELLDFQTGAPLTNPLKNSSVQTAQKNIPL